MTPGIEFVVTLDGHVHAGDVPLVGADAPLFSRGDGVFETVLLRGGLPCLLDEHLVRLEESAEAAGLAAPEPARWRAAVETAASRWGPDEGVLRLVHGRGRRGAVIGFATVSRLPERVRDARRDGVAAVTLVRRGSAGPWSPLRAKSSSYAPNLAALRRAARTGADDAVFTTPEGLVLEGPRSSVVIAVDGTLRTPPIDLPILAGTTVAALFRAAREQGVRCECAAFTAADLLAAQGAWLLSSITLVARLRTLDGVALSSSGAPGVDVAALVDAAVAR